MDFTDVINHLLNFVLPALAIAIFLPLLARLAVWGRVVRPSFGRQLLVNFVAGLAVLLAGLWFWGHDGRMSTYIAMAVVVASAQWLMLRAWRR